MQGPDLPAIDANNTVNYTRTYTYDAGGNMTQYQHAGATPYINTLFVDVNSNRALAQDADNSVTQSTIGNYFDPRGNVTQIGGDELFPEFIFKDKAYCQQACTTVFFPAVRRWEHILYRYSGCSILCWYTLQCHFRQRDQDR
jgi:hypothetical protein